MTTIHRYVTREISRLLIATISVVVSIYLCVDFFEKIDDFLEAGLPATKAVTFFLYNIPFITSQVLPVCILLAVLIVFGLMTKHNEVIALKSSGISAYTLVRPAVSMSILLTIGLFFFNEGVVPITSARANDIWLREVKKKAAVVSRERNIWMKENGSILHIKYYHRAHQTLFGLSRFQIDEDFTLVRRVDARRAIYGTDRWQLFGVLEQVLDPETAQYNVTYLTSRYESLGLSIEDLRTGVTTAEEMSYAELGDHIRKVESEGYDATVYRVDRHAKIAFPFICIILALVGAGISLRGNLREGLPAGVAYGLVVAFAYWIFYSFCVSLGYGGMLPPLVATWAPNLIFFCLGIILLLNAE